LEYLIDMNEYICVFCASSDSVRKEFKDVAELLGKKLAQYNYNLIFGGCNVGLMGAIARVMKSKGRKIIGIMPTEIFDFQIEFKEMDEMILTESMYERKKIMAERSSAFVVLPGGFGTLDEFTDIIVEKSLNVENKPIVVLNTDHYYDTLFDFFNKIIQEKLAKQEFLDLYKVTDNIDTAVEYITQNIKKNIPVSNVVKKW
jgi:cytokinin riboside 5'-monophosphate phosphoribohydrolase